VPPLFDFDFDVSARSSPNGGVFDHFAAPLSMKDGDFRAASSLNPSSADDGYS
jgi:hypothetical protein